MHSHRMPHDAYDRIEYLPFLAVGARPGDTVVVDSDGTVGIVRYLNTLKAERIRRALRDMNKGSDGKPSVRRSRVTQGSRAKLTLV